MSPALSTLRLFRLLAWVHWRQSLAQIRQVVRDAPLLLWVLGALISGYVAAGWWLFHAGLSYVYNFPVVGSLLSQRLLFLIFAFFFVMLVFSNLIIGYSTLFKNRETGMLLTMPVAHATVYRWKFAEALVVSSWALVFLSLPLMLAFGQVHGVEPIFYAQAVLVYAPFVVIPAVLGSALVVAMVRLLARPAIRRTVIAVIVVGVLAALWNIKPVTDVEAAQSGAVLSFDKVLRHSRASLNPFFPSSWLAQGILAWSDGLARQGLFFFALLLSNAMMALLVSSEGIGRCYYGAWTASLGTRAARFQRRAEKLRRRGWRRTALEWTLDRLRPISRPGAALVLKDVRLFWRDPSQWIQFMIFFGLLCMYVLNLRNVAFNFQSPFWEATIAYLNLTASALTLSTLTTRFVFPQFSLEGRRIWILGLAPFGLGRLVLQKFWLSFGVAMALTVGLMLVSALMLRLAPWKVVFFSLSIATMSATLSGLAVGLGALFPNFREENPSKIVSGFGGTLCLVISFIYITFTVALLAWPEMRGLLGVAYPAVPGWIFFALAAVGSAIVGMAPMIVARKRVERMEV